MANEVREHVQVVDEGGIARRQEVVESAPTTRSVLVSRITALLWLIIGAIVVLLAFRFILVAIGANPGTGFVDLIYSLTNPLVAPFAGIVNTPGLDIPAIIAAFVYLLVGYGLIMLFRVLFADTNRVRKVRTYDIER